jgi:pimeloyl-ACP methyl ester carboxylesterase
MAVEPAYREKLLAEHRRVGPRSQHDSLVRLFAFDVRARIETLKVPLLLIRGQQDPTHPPEGEQEIHEHLPQSRLVRLEDAGHFPATERPAQVNRLIEEFLGTFGSIET